MLYINCLIYCKLRGKCAMCVFYEYYTLYIKSQYHAYIFI